MNSFNCPINFPFVSTPNSESPILSGVVSLPSPIDALSPAPAPQPARHVHLRSRPPLSSATKRSKRTTARPPCPQFRQFRQSRRCLLIATSSLPSSIQPAQQPPPSFPRPPSLPQRHSNPRSLIQPRLYASQLLLTAASTIPSNPVRCSWVSPALRLQVQPRLLLQSLRSRVRMQPCPGLFLLLRAHGPASPPCAASPRLHSTLVLISPDNPLQRAMQPDGAGALSSLAPASLSPSSASARAATASLRTRLRSLPGQKSTYPASPSDMRLAPSILTARTIRSRTNSDP